MLTVGSLFSGIGGLDLGLERAGMRVLWQCESDPYCRAVLRKHWPDVPCFEDVRQLPNAPSSGQLRAEQPQDDRARSPRRSSDDASALREGGVDVLAGGFPCQPVSLAGRRRGAADERWLWPEFARLIRFLRPRYALMENVPGLLVGGGMAEVLGDLAALGYDAEWDCVAAAHVGAPHLRYRVFIVAYANERPDFRGESQPGVWPMADGYGGETPTDPTNTDGWPNDWHQARRATRQSGGSGGGDGAGRDWWAVEPDVGRVAHGVPSRVDRLRALGNAVVPQVAEVIGRLIVQHAEAQQ